VSREMSGGRGGGIDGGASSKAMRLLYASGQLQSKVCVNCALSFLFIGTFLVNQSGRSTGSLPQNSSFTCTATMRGLLSPPKPTPSKPVGGDVVYVRAPNPVCVVGFPGTPASIMLGRPKFG
jgi:hypothetical protein